MSNLSVISEDITQLYKPVTALASDCIFVHSCKFCRLDPKIKEEAHELYEKSKSYSRVKEYLNELKLQDDSGVIEFNVPNIRTHILSHYLAQENLVRTRAYIERLESRVNIRMTRAKRLEVQLAILDEKLLNWASREHSSLGEQTKIDDMVIKISKEIRETITALSAEESDLSTARLVIARMTEIFANKMSGINDPKIKSFMVQVVQELDSQKLLT